MKNQDYNNIFCIMTTQRNDEAILKYTKENAEAKKILKNKDAIIFSIGVTKRKNAKLTKIKDHIYVLAVPFEEKYVNLAKKTFLSIKYIRSNFKFNYLLKCDSTKELHLEHLDLKNATEDYFGLSHFRGRKNRAGDWVLNQLGRYLTRTKRRTFTTWASKRNIKIDASYFDDWVYFANWKPYALSFKFSKIVSEVGEAYVHIYNEHLGGCEDHMIGKIYKDMKLAYSLK